MCVCIYRGLVNLSIKNFPFLKKKINDLTIECFLIYTLKIKLKGNNKLAERFTKYEGLPSYALLVI